MNRGPAIPPYNPLDKEKLGESVANALLDAVLSPLPPDPFKGSGVYAIYYRGSFSAYGQIAHPDSPTHPIYVGKAVPKGARKGHLALESATGDSLFQRLREHAESLDQVGLGRSNFLCRHLVVDDIWIPLGESLLIRRYRPVWNVLLDGFGNHDPGGKRMKGITSRWDTVHPGRPWVIKRALSPNQKFKEEWIAEITTYLATGDAPDLVMEEPLTYREQVEE